MTDREHELAEFDLSREEIKRAMDPLRSFHDQLQDVSWRPNGTTDWRLKRYQLIP